MKQFWIRALANRYKPCIAGAWLGCVLCPPLWAQAQPVLQETPLLPINIPNPALAGAAERMTQPDEHQLDDLQRISRYFPEVRLSLPQETGGAADSRINRALQSQDWETLHALLADYPQAADYDPILHAYALGALRRHERRYGEAIALYRTILDIEPELAYPRFDLGVMLFENRQYREAAQTLQQAHDGVNGHLQQLGERYAEHMSRAQSWQGTLQLQYEQTDNVNQASSAREIRINGLRFSKNEASLPKPAHGIRYGAGVSREVNAGGNHYLYAGADAGGIHYWDNQAYNEQSVRLEGGYRNHNANQSWGILPFVGVNWLDGTRYNQVGGAGLTYRRRLGSGFQLSTAFSHTRKSYRDQALAERYNGWNNQAALTAQWQPHAHWLLFAGVDSQREHVRDEAESSWRHGIRSGVVYQQPDSWGARLSARYARRQFDADHFFYGYRRRDQEYQLNSALWHGKLSWRQWVPKLNFNYHAVRSNMPELYSRSGSSWFMSVEKAF